MHNQKSYSHVHALYLLNSSITHQINSLAFGILLYASCFGYVGNRMLENICMVLILVMKVMEVSLMKLESMIICMIAYCDSILSFLHIISCGTMTSYLSQSISLNYFYQFFTSIYIMVNTIWNTCKWCECSSA